MSTLNSLNHCCIGSSHGRTPLNSVEKRCEGCRRKIHFSRGLLADARRQAKHTGKALSLVCLTCGDVWLKKIMTSGGDVIGESTVMDRDLLPRMKELRDMNNQRN